MRTILLVLDGLGIGSQKDSTKFIDKHSNTLNNINKAASLKDTIFDELKLFNEFDDPYYLKIENKEAYISKCNLSYPGADSNLGHQNMTGINPIATKNFLKDFHCKFTEELSHLFDNIKYVNEVLYLDDCIYISNNMECDPGLNINVIGNLEKTSFPEVLKVGKIIRNIASCSRVITMGGKCFSEIELEKSIDQKIDGETNTFFNGVNIPKLNIYNKDYNVVHLSTDKNSRENMIDIFSRYNHSISLIGKTANLFESKNATYMPNVETELVLKDTVNQMKIQKEGLIFANVQEIDLAGHSQDVIKAQSVLLKSSKYIRKIIRQMNSSDTLIITADHGNDPTIGHSYHTREIVPFILIKNSIKDIRKKSINLSDIGHTITLNHLNIRTQVGEKIY